MLCKSTEREFKSMFTHGVVFIFLFHVQSSCVVKYNIKLPTYAWASSLFLLFCINLITEPIVLEVACMSACTHFSMERFIEEPTYKLCGIYKLLINCKKKQNVVDNTCPMMQNITLG